MNVCMSTRSTVVVQPFVDDDSHTITYVVFDPVTKKSAIIDSVLDYDHVNVRTYTKSADLVVSYIKEHSLTNEWILETHIHADHISASTYLKEKVGGTTGIGNQIPHVQRYLKTAFDLNDTFKTDGSQFDHLFSDHEDFLIGTLKARALHTPGHTPADLVFEIDGVLFMGDTVLAPDSGTARCDFPGGSAEILYESVRKILESYPDATSLYLCHDYPEQKNRAFQYVTSVGEQRKHNIHLHDGLSKASFVEMRTARDKTLDLPRYIFPAVQINGNGGALIPGEFIKLSYNKKVL